MLHAQNHVYRRYFIRHGELLIFKYCRPPVVPSCSLSMASQVGKGWSFLLAREIKGEEVHIRNFRKFQNCYKLAQRKKPLFQKTN